MSIYKNYTTFIESVLNNNSLKDFKKNHAYRQILEHTTPQQGAQYLSLIELDKNIVKRFCDMNDSIGSPVLTNYSNLSASPSSLRYLYHASLILQYIKNLKLDNVNIIEIGGGYGGLCLCINYLMKYYEVPITSYTIFDLKEPSMLQQKYLSNFDIDFQTYFYDASNLDVKLQHNNYFLISNYAYSEFDENVRQSYNTTIFPYIENGFMVWNSSDIPDFGKIYRSEIERPLTGKHNKFLYF